MHKPRSLAAAAAASALLLLLFTTTVAAAITELSAAVPEAPFLLGIGKADVTGPAADVNMMGYALLEQTAKGLHNRQWARAYLVADSASQ